MKLKLLEKSISLSTAKNYRTKIFGLFLFIMIGFTSVKAQYTAIPDAAFEQGLINQGLDSGAIDGQVLTASIAGVTNLNLQGGSIKDLTGIKDFASLQELYLNYQQLTALDLSGMASLRVVEIYGNDLTGINLNGLFNLETFRCGSNALTTLDLSGLTNLTLLSCGQNLLTALTLTGLDKLETFQCNENKITSLNLSGLTNLTTLNFGANKLTTADLSGLTKLTDLACYQNQLTDLNVSALTALTNLNCSGNNLTVLDVSNNPDLQYFFCTENPALTCVIVNNVANANINAADENWGKDATANYSLSCSPYAAADQTFCGGATVANLAATGTAIKWYLDATDGTALDPATALVSGNYYASQTINGTESDRTLVAVVVNTTPLPSRNMGVNGTLCRPSTYATLASKFNNPDAIKIYASATSTTPIDSALEITPGSFLTLYITQTINGCESARLTDSQTFVNPNYEPTVTDQTFCARNNPTVADLTATATGGGNTIKWYLSMASVTPLLSTRALATRDYYVTQSAYPCGESPRKKVSVTVNQYDEIYIYTCGSYTWPLNGVTYTQSENVTFDDGCTIHYLYLTIAPVDVPVIHSQFRLTGATIADITITQGQSVQFYADATGGAPLAGTTVLENKTYYASQRQTFYDTNAQCESDRVAVDITLGTMPEGYTFIADERFEQKLIDLGYDDVIDNKVLTANIDTVTDLNLVALSISNLTGIKGFKSLKTLDLIYNSLSNLDVSGMTSLERIGAYGNYLRTVNLNGVKNLKEINFGNSALTDLNLSGLTALEKIEVSGPLTNLDLSDQVNLTDLNCRYTKITGLNLKNKPNLVYMNATQAENLTCIIVDDIAAANANTNWSKDGGANYSEGTAHVTTATVCDSYTWAVNTVTYTTSGKYTVVNNCHSEELNLTVNPTINSTKTVTACESYVWDYNGQTYTESGIYTPKGATPCESATLNLTITPSVVPTFAAIDPICQGAVLADLPTVSNNGITGTWSPALNNQATTTYTFVPELNACATQTTLEIVVTPAVTISKTATACGSYVWDYNGLTYTESGIYTATGVTACESATLNLTITPSVVPTFEAIDPICQGAVLADLPTVSNNGIKGTWSPALNNQATTTYTFVPELNACATQTTLEIVVTPAVTISKTATACRSYVWDYNGLTYTESGIYSVAGATACASATLNLTITPSVVPTFTPIAAICQGAVLADLPTVSNNGITGTWSPALNNQATTTYTFVPELNACATQTTLEIVVTPAIDGSVDYSNGILSSNMPNATYQWIDCANNNAVIPGAVNQTYTPATSGTYSVVITSGSCSVTSDCIKVTTLGRTDFDPVSNLRVYPNPSHDVFNIEADTAAKIEVYDSLGKEIRTENINEGTSKLDMSSYPTGLYFLKITNENNQRKTVKIVKN
ncbi:T9SS type A sorting domain-containing protein [Flavobacterium sp. LC2016-23]|uniref:T9SS type A sorting domain-containing protein n=1 Tax=Flavobacterium sp. LC2016-23 TaxID=2666330 RepID=UPI0012AF345B|nr:T9SS type A sorting domain-containing protein [Flavobacterium sp. LC2016-23]MRX41285.1 T9SS type A sorting domain-containing protein [Flavobacterium sp. LC2016-23]